jgi:hypothetical protein
MRLSRGQFDQPSVMAALDTLRGLSYAAVTRKSVQKFKEIRQR